MDNRKKEDKPEDDFNIGDAAMVAFLFVAGLILIIVCVGIPVLAVSGSGELAMAVCSILSCFLLCALMKMV